jgi:hypothetical protein
MRTIVLSVFVSVVAIAALARAEMMAPPPVITSNVVGSNQDVVSIRDVVTQEDGTVTGVVVNTSNHTLRDVRLMIAHEWLWSNEFHPGTDDPGRAEAYVVPGDIPPGGQVRFSSPADPLPHRSDGHFRTRVDVVGLTQIG